LANEQRDIDDEVTIDGHMRAHLASLPVVGARSSARADRRSGRRIERTPHAEVGRDDELALRNLRWHVGPGVDSCIVEDHGCVGTRRSRITAPCGAETSGGWRTAMRVATPVRCHECSPDSHSAGARRRLRHLVHLF
jgi:hypothetical protein